MRTLFISDLHLADERPAVTRLLLEFLAGDLCAGADSLYVLGDLFEFWIGDDVISKTAVAVAPAFDRLARSGVDLYFQHGNRDFLVGEAFSHRCGMELLPEETVIELMGEPCLLLHGDTLCTDDHDYQAFRKQVRNPAFQQEFLSMPVEQRLEMARSARDQSQAKTSGLMGTMDEDIMDVNADEVVATFERTGTPRMIHGHTHRPAVHHVELGGGRTAERIVLSDWRETGSCLVVGDDGYRTRTITASS